MIAYTPNSVEYFTVIESYLSRLSKQIQGSPYIFFSLIFCLPSAKTCIFAHTQYSSSFLKLFCHILFSCLGHFFSCCALDWIMLIISDSCNFNHLNNMVWHLLFVILFVVHWYFVTLPCVVSMHLYSCMDYNWWLFLGHIQFYWTADQVLVFFISSGAGERSLFSICNWRLHIIL